MYQCILFFFLEIRGQGLEGLNESKEFLNNLWLVIYCENENYKMKIIKLEEIIIILRVFNGFNINILEGINGSFVIIIEKLIFKIREINCGFMYKLVKF